MHAKGGRLVKERERTNKGPGQENGGGRERDAGHEKGVSQS